MMMRCYPSPATTTSARAASSHSTSSSSSSFSSSSSLCASSTRGMQRRGVVPFAAKKRMTTITNRDGMMDNSNKKTVVSDEMDGNRKRGNKTVSAFVAFTASVLLSGESFVQPLPAFATFSKTQFEILCPVGDEGTECRMKALADDKGAYLNDYEYQTKSGAKKSMKTSAAATAGRNTDLTAYQSDTLALADAMDELFAMDLYSTAREPAIKQLQKKANDWTGRYCPGGSSKQASGRSMYNAVNQLLGHFASNGLAPLPSARMEIVNKNIASARDLIAQGR